METITKTSITPADAPSAVAEPATAGRVDTASEAPSQVSSAIESAKRKLPPIDWTRSVPFLLLHVACLSVFLVGVSPIAIIVCLLLFHARVFGLTAFYHRYFSHRSFKTSRWFQFCGALLGSSALQRGPIWWAAHHRNHHQHSDDPEDVHSPRQMGFWFSHMGWFMTRKNYGVDKNKVRDWLKFPELRFLDRFDTIVPLSLAAGTFVLGWCLGKWVPSLGTSGMQMLVWGFLLSTIALYHTTYSINSLAHVIGFRRYKTSDDSRNNWWLALLTFGEGWHNNHHHYPASARQGFYWWEIDVTYYMLVVLSWFGLVWDIKGVPQRVLAEGRKRRESK